MITVDSLLVHYGIHGEATCHHQSTMSVVTLWVTPHHQTASCCYECLMVSHGGRGTQPYGELNPLNVYPPAVTVNMGIFIISIYSYLIFVLAFFLLLGVIIWPDSWALCGCRPFTGGRTRHVVYHSLQCPLYRNPQKNTTPFFYFNCISFGYIWHPYGVYLLPGVDNGY